MRDRNSKVNQTDNLHSKLEQLIKKHPWLTLLYDVNNSQISELFDEIHSEGYDLGYDEGYSDGYDVGHKDGEDCV